MTVLKCISASKRTLIMMMIMRVALLVSSIVSFAFLVKYLAAFLMLDYSYKLEKFQAYQYQTTYKKCPKPLWGCGIREPLENSLT